jgi:hypothetical protein
MLNAYIFPRLERRTLGVSQLLSWVVLPRLLLAVTCLTAALKLCPQLLFCWCSPRVVLLCPKTEIGGQIESSEVVQYSVDRWSSPW